MGRTAPANGAIWDFLWSVAKSWGILIHEPSEIKEDIVGATRGVGVGSEGGVNRADVSHGEA